MTKYSVYCTGENKWQSDKENHRVTVVVVLLYGLVCIRLQHSKNIKSCIASRWKSNTDNKTLLLLKWSLHSIIHRKYKTRDKDISSKVCGHYMVRLTLSKNSNSASLTILLYRLFTPLSTDGDNNNVSVIMELLFCFIVMPEWYIKSNISFRSFSYLLQWSKKCSVVSNACPQSHIGACQSLRVVTRDFMEAITGRL